MTSGQFAIMFLCLGIGVVALAQVNSLLAGVRVEIRGRVRDAALRRARRLTALALASYTAIAVIVAHVGWPSEAAPVATALAGGQASPIGRNLQLSHALGAASGLGPHLREK